jgi:Protein of unknown function (DUF2950)
MKNGILITSMALAFAAAAPSFAQERFDSADAAAQAIMDAAEKHDAARIAAVFGPKGSAILTCGNAEQDRAEQSEFARLFREKHQLTADPRNPDRMLLSIGAEDWPFPVPIVRSNGKWSFDPSESKVEMDARRIGAHELDAIEICIGYVEAQKKYASEYHGKGGMLKYAAHMLSTAEGGEGLYREGTDQPLVPQALADATWDGQKKSAKPYHGYYFRILDGQGSHATGGAHNYLVKGMLIGGFGLVAWPAQYGVTGINTFMVNQDGVVYEKDIAIPAGGAAPVITRYDPDPSWKPVD